jgi:Glycosyltransferases involved in cell wall biogenesis
MSKDGNHLISIVIPTLNEAENLPQLFSNIRAVLSQYRYEIIIVDGHSRDKTVSIAKKNGARVIFEEKGRASPYAKA